MSLATRLTAFAQAVGADIKSLNSKLPYKGDWNAATTYKKGDLVWYASDLWMAVTTISGPAEYPDPDYPSVWRLLTEGMPLGGNTGQILAKYADNSFYTEWIDPPSGGGASLTISSATAMQSANGAATNVPLGTWTTMPIGQLLIDPDVGAFSLSGGVVTIRDAGWYHVSASLLSSTAAEHTLALAIDKDATPSDGSIANNAAKSPYVRVGADGTFKALAGDKVYLHAWCSTGAISAYVGQFSIERVGGPKGDKGDPGGTMGSFNRVVHPTADWGIPAVNTAVPGLSVTVPDTGDYAVTFTSDLNTFPANGYVIAYVAKNGVIVVGQDAAVKQVYATDVSQRWPFNKHWLIPAVAGDVITIVMSNGGHASNSISAVHSSMIVFRPGGPKGDKGDTGGNATVPIDPWHVVGAAGEPAFLNNWSTPSGLPGLMYRKDPMGRVWLYGVVQSGTNATACVTLPAGYRPFTNPTYFDILTSNGQAGGFVNIGASGAVVVTTPNGQAFIDVSFDTGLVTAMPTGPQGPKGDTGGNATVPMDTWHKVGTAGEPAFKNNWGNFAGDPRIARFRKYPDGKVKLGGIIQRTSGAGTIPFTLPVGYRPAIAYSSPTVIWPGDGLATATINIDPATGDISIVGTNSNSFTYLDGVEFDTDTVTQVITGPTGPQGLKGDKGDRGDSLTVPIDPWRVIGTPGNPAFSAGFNALDEVAFRKDPLGRVYLRGSIGSASGNAVSAFTLPVGYRPTQRIRAVSVGNQNAPGQWEAQINVYVDGTVVVYFTGASATAYVSLDQISFDTGTVTQMPIGPQGPKGDTGGVSVIKTLNWNTATTPNLYRSTNDGLEKTLNGPGDSLNPPPQAGIVFVHENGYVVQRVWDLDTQRAWTRYRIYDGSWTPWVADLTKPDLWSDIMVGGAAPKDGDERYFQNATMKAAGVLWRFRYDATAPSGKPKWVFIGGQGMYDRHDGDNFATPAATWVDAGAAGPGFVLPLQGDYMVDYGGLIYSNVPGVYAQIGVSVGGVVSGYNIIHGNFGAGYTDYEDQSRSDRFDNCGQGVLVKLVYQSNPLGGGYQRRWIRVTPIRVVM